MEILDYFLDNDINARSTIEYSDEEKGLTLVRPVAWGDAADAVRAGQRGVAARMHGYVIIENRGKYETVKAAVAIGDVELVEWLQEQVGMDSERGLRVAAANGHLNMTRWMYETRS